ncbi:MULTISPECIES: hypothetical protein [Herbidospora]|nr:MULTISPECIES: hypothetical protein [Herbidospora]
MSYVLNLQATKVAAEAPGDGADSWLSFLSPVTCFSTTSLALC